MRLLRLIIPALAALLGLASPAAAQDRLDGRYNGIQDAAGASISIEPAGEGYSGAFRDARGNSQPFQATRVGDAAEAVLDMDGRKVLMRMVPLPYGAEVALVPYGADGSLAPASGRIVNFVRQGLDVPQPPADFVPPPGGAGGRVAAYSFLVSYEFWSPTGVRDGYLALAPRHRTLIRLFPAVQLDVIWKLCLAPGADEALGTALRGQGVTCETVVSGIAEAQRSGRFDDYKDEVARQGEALRTAIRCGDGYVMSKETCDAAARTVSRAATSLETAASVLRRY